MNRPLGKAALSFIVMMTFGAPANAQSVSPQAATAAAPCELHIWPAERMASLSSGLLGGGLLDAALHAGKDASNKAQMASALDSPTQLEALQSERLVELLALPAGTTVVPHAEPVDRHTMNKIKVRRAESNATCYSELIVADLFYQKSAMYGRSLRTLFMLREFGNDNKIDREYKAWGGNKLKLFPAKAGEDAIAANEELAIVFKKNFEEYANNERKARAVSNPMR